MATIYRRDYLTRLGESGDLLLEKGDKTTQFGLIQPFKLRNGTEFLNINVHLNGGKTEKDKDVRNAQLNILFAVLK